MGTTQNVRVKIFHMINGDEVVLDAESIRHDRDEITGLDVVSGRNMRAGGRQASVVRYHVVWWESGVAEVPAVRAGSAGLFPAAKSGDEKTRENDERVRRSLFGRPVSGPPGGVAPGR